VLGLNSGIAEIRVFDSQGFVAQRYDAQVGTTYLLRPDQHVTARWKRFDLGVIRDALNTATCN
jgi:3-(3-hydroxy-phenyl)propionate hydroxylase